MDKFKKGKWYRFVPTKTPSFSASVSSFRYHPFFIWELDVKTRVLQAKEDNELIVIDGYVISRNWCEELK